MDAAKDPVSQGVQEHQIVVPPTRGSATGVVSVDGLEITNLSPLAYQVVVQRPAPQDTRASDSDSAVIVFDVPPHSTRLDRRVSLQVRNTTSDTARITAERKPVSPRGRLAVSDAVADRSAESGVAEADAGKQATEFGPDLAQPSDAPTFLELLHRTGRTPDRSATDFVGFAAAVQAARWRSGRADTALVNRSTALWSILRLDPSIAAALRPTGLDPDGLSQLLGIDAPPEPLDVADVALHPDFTRALRDYLQDLRGDRPVGLADLTVAVLRDAVENGGAGMLRRRLGRLQVDLAAATAAAERLLPPDSVSDPSPGPSEPIDDADADVYFAAVPVLEEALRRSPAVIAVDQRMPSGGAVARGQLETAAEMALDEALRRVVPPDARVIAADRAGEFDPADLPGPDERGEVLLRMDTLGSHWRVLGAALTERLRDWTRIPGRWFAGIVYDDEIDVLQDPGFKALNIPVVRFVDVRDELSVRDEVSTSSRPWPTSAATAIAELAGGTSPDLVDPTVALDLGRDRLNVATFVTMFADVIADRQTKLPLSVGLFGEWGSGKSYFMGLLRGRIQALAAQDPDRYHQHIVQVGFNAWHYSDSNLWASLGDVIFEQLIDPAKTQDEQLSARLKRDLAEHNDRRHALEAAAERAREEAARLRQQIDQARRNKGIRARAVVKAVLDNRAIGGQLRKAWDKLGITDDLDRAGTLVGDVQAGRTEAAAIRRSLMNWRSVTVLVVVLAVLLSLALVASTRIEPLSAQLAGAIATASGVLGWVCWGVHRARSGLSSLRRLIDDVDTRSSAQTDRELAPQLDELRKAEAGEAMLRAQLDQVVERVGQLGTELAQASPGQRLYHFLADRAGSEDYRGQLSLISTIRKDFEQLRKLMQTWAEERQSWQKKREAEQLGTTPFEAGPCPPAPPPIDRIVLYIDDLDRCSPRQVVDVLQAVHLLLALDLFVVVVGVDPRWLLRSLRGEFRATLDRPAPDDEHWSATTPIDYLEKIFNIPFLLPAMTPASFQSLLHGLTEEGLPTRPDGMTAKDDSGAPSADGRQQPLPFTDTGPTGTGMPPDGSGRAPSDASDTASSGAPPADDRSVVGAALHGRVVRGEPLQPQELALLSALAPLVHTPRSTTRLLNLYRLLRSTRDLGPAASWLGRDDQPGEYQAVAVLLGLLTAYPERMTEVILAPPDSTRRVAGGLRFRSADEAWQDFVVGLRPRLTDVGWRNDLATDLDEQSASQWRKLVDELSPANALVTLPDLAAFQRWEPHVARFSFHLAPLVLDRRAPRGHGHVMSAAAGGPASAGSSLPGGQDEEALRRLRNDWDPVLTQIVQAIGGSQAARQQATELLDQLACTSLWGGLVAVLRRVLAGERAAAPLRAGLDRSDSAVVDRLLEMLDSAAPVPDAGIDS